MLMHSFQIALYNANKLSSQIEEALILSEGQITPEIEEILKLRVSRHPALSVLPLASSKPC